MKSIPVIAALCLVGGFRLGAQEEATAVSSSPHVAVEVVREEPDFSALKRGLQLKPAVEAVEVPRGLQLEGPVPYAVTPPKPREIPRRILALVNPFAPMDPPAVVTRSGKISSLAWSTTVGWRPGCSAFPDERTHSPLLTFCSLSASRR